MANAAEGRFADLRIRILSALVVAAAAFGCIWAGGIWIAALAALACGQMMIEWSWITLGGRRWPGYVGPLAAGAAAAPVAMLIWGPSGAAMLIAALALWASASMFRGNPSGLLDALGATYISAAGAALVALRGIEPFGFLTILWAVLVVVAADVGGYFAGRLVGGPRLWPAVSPKKTWAGLIGGIALAVLVGGIFSWQTTGTWFYEVCTVSALAAVLAQAGDLGESALKRHFGVKDSGSLIPGHGGVLDRLDGHMIAILVAAGVTFWRGQPVFIW